MQTPVLLIIFNRSDTAMQVINRLKEVSAAKLYVYSDGPRSEKTGEAALLQETQQSILSAVNWPCEVSTRFQGSNEGPRIAIGKAINWFFEHETEGIILEHDCVPCRSFFSFSTRLLEHYRNDERIMHISGDNFQFGKIFGDGSYYFSKIPHVWGFATWKRAWAHYDVDMKLYPEFRNTNRINNIISHKASRKYWNRIFEKAYNKELKTWDYQWAFSIWCANGLTIIPNQNLVSNVGFDEKALHTVNPKDKLSKMQTFEIENIIHPTFVIPDYDADIRTMNKLLNPSLLKYFLNKLKERTAN